MKEGESGEEIRLDKWLWAARFFKTRALAAGAVAGGKVQLNGARAKPGRVVRIADEVKIRRGPYEWVVIVRGLGKQRGPACQAQLLYEETDEGKQAREAVALEIRAQGFHDPRPEGRPSKKARRDIMRFRRGGGE